MHQTNENLSKAATALRILAVTAIEKAASGHPGMPLGFADVFSVLAAEFLRFAPWDPKWFARDRLVLSAGHGSMLLYAFYYLSGYKNFTIEDIKQFRQLGGKTPGHPEYGAFDAIETTTGPLGQGLANAVGMAIANKKYQAHLGKELSRCLVYCIVGDGCLMEGISYEAASIAGHLCLNNLIVLFDDNKITIDGPTSLTISEDQAMKFSSLGWEVISIDAHNYQEIKDALSKAQTATKPVFIQCRTIIGYGSSKANCASSHGSALGPASFEALKKSLNWQHDDSAADFHIPEEYLNLWHSFAEKNKQYYADWQEAFAKLPQEKKDYTKSFSFKEQTIKQITAVNCDTISYDISDEATRVSAGKIIQIIAKLENKAIIGSADLSASVGLTGACYKQITSQDFSGNFIHYGTREHAMGAIMNGLALEGFMPIGGTFLVFSDYMRPSIRLSSLMNLGVIYIMTHDSIGLGEDGPTHQPVEHLSSLRAIPNLTVFRPADRIEIIGAFKYIAQNNKPYLLSLSRQSLTQTHLTNADLSSKGMYFLHQEDRAESNADVALYASGSEVMIAKQVMLILQDNHIKVDLISSPCITLFWMQEKDYIKSILATEFRVIIEAGTRSSWHSVLRHDSMFFGVEEFGYSAPCQMVYDKFGLNAKNIAMKIIKEYENRN